MSRFAPWLLALAALAACSEPPTITDCIPGIDPTCVPPDPDDEIVGGLNLTQLFAAPTPAEVDAALAVEMSATDASLPPLTAADPAPDGARQFVLGLDDGAGRILTALVRVPGAAGATSQLPVVVVLPDGTGGASAADFLTAPGYGRLATDVVQVVVAYRGEALVVARDSIRSSRPGRAFLDDVPDVLAVLAALAPIPRADTSRVALVGAGRGGTVALLAAETGSVEGVVSLGAVSDLFADSFVELIRAELRGEAPAPTPAGFLRLQRPVTDVRNGILSLAEARVALLHLSPARLRPRERLPALLALHGEDDVVVAPDHLDALAAGLAGTGGPPRTLALVENAGHGDLLVRPSVQSQIASFLTDLFFP
ncbi:alpha/beta hydrolase family protein [Rubrivirga sp. IMCC43871]|uniref:alpha/beta hydrolase family protein n=1 Tax=Rubrivirga sp. IMCC43871 TaxID=3391575 RepID=UPI00398FD02B